MSGLGPQIHASQPVIHKRISEMVSRSPLHSLWNLQGVSSRVVAQHTWNSLLSDNLFGRAAELGFYFLFALFPTFFCASSILGIAAHSAADIYGRLLHYLSIVIPTAAMGTVLNTYNETTAAASSGKVTFGLVASVWSASVGTSAIQDTLNTVYKVRESRSYFKARLYAMALTLLLMVLVSLILTSLLGADFFAALAHKCFYNRLIAALAAGAVRFTGWTTATALLAFSFAVVYYWAPDVKKRRWHWLTPGGAVGISGWLTASFALRLYLHFYNSYSFTYGSLGAAIILLTWFYLTGLMLLLGAEINSEIEAEAAKLRLQAAAGAGCPLAVPDTDSGKGRVCPRRLVKSSGSNRVLMISIPECKGMGFPLLRPLFRILNSLRHRFRLRGRIIEVGLLLTVLTLAAVPCERKQKVLHRRFRRPARQLQRLCPHTKAKMLLLSKLPDAPTCRTPISLRFLFSEMASLFRAKSLIRP